MNSKWCYKKNVMKWGALIIVSLLFFCFFTGCQNKNDTPTDLKETSLQPEEEFMNQSHTTEPEEKSFAKTYEAEDATFTGNVKISSNKSGFTGKGFLTGFESDDDSCTFNVDVPKSGFYDLNFRSLGIGGYKENYVVVNGDQLGVVAVESEKFTNSKMDRVYLNEGENTVSLTKHWGWICLDALAVRSSQPLDESIYDVSAALINSNASDGAKRLMSYLADQYGKYILSGQNCDTGINGKEIWSIQSVTNKKPAVLGLDFIDYSLSRIANGSTSKAVEYAIEGHESGAIITLAWHWNAPEKYITDIWWRAFYTDATNINLSRIMSGKDKEGYDLLMADIDAIAEHLKRLQDADVPVLWRPLHEASGGWFWWGASGADACKQLWITMYDKLTNEHGLNNLIWLWNGQNKDWYPGDEYVDIIGEDIYAGEQVYSSQFSKYISAVNYTKNTKMVVLSENGCIPDPDLMIRDGAMWGFFATWGGEFVLKNQNLNAYSDKYTDSEMLKKIYNHEKIITLDELPDLKTYKIREK